MSATKDAIPYGKDYFDEDTQRAPFKCKCGYQGTAPELLHTDVDISTSSWCPKCKQETWEFI